MTGSAFHAPLLWLAAMFAAGSALSVGAPWPWLASLAALGVVALRGPFTLRAVTWGCAFLVAGAANRAATESSAREQVKHAQELSAVDAMRWVGVVERVLQEEHPARILVRLESAVSDEGATQFPARTVLRLPITLRPPPEGSRVAFRAHLHAPHTSRFPGDHDAKASLGSKGVDLTGSIHDELDLAIVGDEVDVVTRARRATRVLIRSTLPDDAAALTEAFVLGDSAIMTPELRKVFDDAGASHLLAVSGLQATLLAALLYALVRWLWGRASWLLTLGDPGPAAAVLCVPAIFLYALYAGGAASVMRSAWMAVAVMVGVLIRRKGAVVQTLGAGALIMLALEPRAVNDAGFLLSFLSVLSLALIAPGLAESMAPTEKSPRVGVMLLATLATSVAAVVATTPLVAHLFGRVAPWAALSNVVLVPVGGIALPAVVVATLLGTALDLAWLVKASGAVSMALHDLCVVFAQLPGATLEVPPPPSWAVATGLGGALLCAVGRRWAVGAGLGVVGLSLAVAFIPPRHDGNLRVLMAPVGQGDGAIVTLPSGETVVIDAGGSFISEVDPGRTVMLPILKRLGVQRLRLMILSHPHPDHMNGLITLVKELRPEELWWNGQASRHPKFQELMTTVKEVGTRVVTPEPPAGAHVATVELGGATFEVLHPFPARDGPEAPRFFPELDENDNSLVVRISHGSTRVLFPGDVEVEAERMLTEGPVRERLRADVLKVPHHGSITSTSEVLLEAVQPRHALMGVGAGNPWGFPHPDVVRRLAEHGVDIWRTDEDGLITVVLDGRTVCVSAYAR
ncbi:MAG: DNA internalization-related competence protein ComEC/Rec2 [Myxococcota bacterium]